MHLRPIIMAGVLVVAPGSGFAQEWTEFASREDQFTCNFPGRPRVSTTTWTSEYGAELSARVYLAESPSGRYSMTVVDYGDIERILTEKSKACPIGAETCRGNPPSTGLGYWRVDLQGALVYGTWKLLSRPGVQATHFMWNFIDLVAGHQLHLTNSDKSRTFASIYMHEKKLYIMEGTVPDGFPEPGLFQQSLGWLDENGTGIRYSAIYLHGAPRPSIATRGGQGGSGRINAPGAIDGQGR